MGYEKFKRGVLAVGGFTGDGSKITNLAGGALAAGSVPAAALKLFISGVLTGTGSAQNIAHGLGVVPASVVIVPLSMSSSYAATEGAHTSTNAIVTVTSGATFKVEVRA
jgi:hypothetical protein